VDFSGVSRLGWTWPYEQVAAVIAEAIHSGELAPGQRLPSQAHLAQMAGVSKPTVQNALALLRDEGMVRTIPRLGTFVTR
jgi:DNA-binding GntR family transcriptional regulator